MTFISLTSCGPQGLKMDFGKLTTKDLKAQKGEPSKIETSLVKEKQVYIYDEDEKYQIDGEYVEARFRRPTKEEESFLYWKHKFKRKKTTLRRLPVPEGSHLEPEQELICLKLGISIIYDPNIDKVVRIIEYAKQK